MSNKNHAVMGPVFLADVNTSDGFVHVCAVYIEGSAQCTMNGVVDINWTGSNTARCDRSTCGLSI